MPRTQSQRGAISLRETLPQARFLREADVQVTSSPPIGGLAAPGMYFLL